MATDHRVWTTGGEDPQPRKRRAWLLLSARFEDVGVIREELLAHAVAVVVDAGRIVEGFEQRRGAVDHPAEQANALELGGQGRIQLEPRVDRVGVGGHFALALDETGARVDGAEDALGELIEPLLDQGSRRAHAAPLREERGRVEAQGKAYEAALAGEVAARKAEAEARKVRKAAEAEAKKAKPKK